MSSLSPSPFVNSVQCIKLKLQLFVTSVDPTMHAPHMSTLIHCNTECFVLAALWSVQKKLSNGGLHVTGHSPLSPNMVVLLTVGGGGPTASFNGWWVRTMDLPFMQPNRFSVTSGKSSLQTWTQTLWYGNFCTRWCSGEDLKD